MLDTTKKLLESGIASLVRHVLTLASGFFATVGLTADDIGLMITSLTTFAVAIAWSLIEKGIAKLTKKKEPAEPQA
jgi:hypothetical protein